ncbi:MAG: phage terminase large subunit [Thermodesulfobacteriota bacterium]|nr:phage terminase large subunit [Thermodesulfobacteriota bacterium]
MTLQAQQFDPEAFAAILASKSAPGVVESFTKTNDICEKTEHLVDYIEYEGRGAWQREPHLKLLCEKLESVAAGHTKRLMVFMPPRSGKSHVCSKKFPAWYLRKYPDRYIMITSYSADLAFDFSRIARNTIQDEREIFPNINVDQQARAVKHWTIKGRSGGLIAAGVGGPITGRGASIAIIDDPFKNYEEAASEVVRESVWQWYRSTLRTRLDQNGAIFLIQTRWHQNDLAGRLLQEMKEGTGEQWEVISLPGIAEENDQLGRQTGDALSPRFPIEELKSIRKAMGGYLFSALYQQNPRAKEGNYFKAHWFVDGGDIDTLLKKWQASGCYIPFYAAMDFAIGQKQQNDYNVICVMAMGPGNEKILVDRIRFKNDADGIADEIINVQMKWKPLLFGFEEGQIRKAIWPTVKRKMKQTRQAINSTFLVPIGDKLARARTAQAQMRQNEWLFPLNADWYNDFKEEMLGFPNATHDDDPDAFAHLARLISDGGGALFPNI